MGNTTNAPTRPPPAGGGDPQPKAREPENTDNPHPEGPRNHRQPELRDGVVYDPEAGKYFDPYTGEYVVTPGNYEPPPPGPRPLRVKVRKRDHVRLRKKRRPPKPERIPTTPPPPPPKPPRKSKMADGLKGPVSQPSAVGPTLPSDVITSYVIVVGAQGL
ncbi:hypothetical protein ElyMa_004543800 [Elysia marginata]|uniref:OCRE domain-containing protein n=1 Tax=Elysia marginata TaxID=1093978 RepID=A0AAV4HPB9_9GAST|nr:hypothetical protein ElyMa_004543800 [Elysia marginata]